ncbi:MAG: hypothetical protein OXI22_07700 [Defluviicoccus sp.]|nr:hypothetical protein [Defluviicoccus sp.]MDE0383748.1 hypothetical protein [Defluviicoccus sp.]
MLRRLIDGAVLIVLAWFLIVRLDAGQAVLGLAIAAVIVWTVWRIHRLWRKYRGLLRELAEAEAAKLSDDPKEVERAERVLRERRMMHAADMTLMSGFVLGAAASDPVPMEHGVGMDGGHDGIGGGFGGGDMGGGFGGGEG